MRVFLDTNVLVSAFATRGLCSDVLRHILAEHELLVGEVVLAETRRALRDKLHMPVTHVDQIEEFLRQHTVVPRPRRLDIKLKIRDADDAWILASAVAGAAEVLVTGDRDLLDIADKAPIPVRSPREFWRSVSGAG